MSENVSAELVTKSHNMRKRMNYRLRQRRLSPMPRPFERGELLENDLRVRDYSTDPALVGVRDE